MKNAMLLYAHYSDKELLRRIRGGQRCCFEVLVRRHSASLYRLSRVYAFPHHEGEELVAGTFLQIFDLLSKQLFAGSFRTHLSKQMIHTCLEAKQLRLPTEANLGNEPSCAPARSVLHYERPLPVAMPVKLESLIEQLAIPLRSVFVLVEADGYSLAEVAFLLNTTEENVRMRLTKAKTQLRKSLRRWYQLPELFALDRLEVERIVADVMGRIDEESGIPMSAPCF